MSIDFRNDFVNSMVNIRETSDRLLDTLKKPENTESDNFPETEKEYRKKWLPEELNERLEKIQDHVRKVLKKHSDKKPLRYFTPHGEEHYKAVQENIYALLPGRLHEKLSQSEKFFLLTSAWTHDIGMIRGVMEKDETADDEKIRDEHHTRSEKFINQNFLELSIGQEEAAAFGLLARFHRRRLPLSECPEFLSVTGHGKMRIRLLAAYLRLADALHSDTTRSPVDQYAIMLAYDIPTSSKLHWLKSKFINGLDIDIKKRKITIEFKFPAHSHSEEKDNMEEIRSKPDLDDIYDDIIQDLSEEVDSVKDVLVREGISYFLTVEKKICEVELDNQLLNDIDEISNKYSLLNNPSSSALLSLVLKSIENIIECQLIHITPKQDISKISLEETPIPKKLEEFLNDIEKNVLKSRKCHTGLKKLIENLRTIIRPDIVIIKQTEPDGKQTEPDGKQTEPDGKQTEPDGKQTEPDGKQTEPDKRIEKKEIRHTRKIDGNFLTKYLDFLPENITSDINKRFSQDKEEIPLLVIDLKKFVSEQIKKLESGREKVRHNAFCYFTKSELKKLKESKEVKKKLKDHSLCINVLVYGYSELAIKTICGFRDAVLREKIAEYSELLEYSADLEYQTLSDYHQYKPFYRKELEKEASDIFRIFVCEGQPKNKTAWGGRIIYHDGLNYSAALKDTGFNKIYIIPDAISASLIAPHEDFRKMDSFPEIDYVIVGTNGFNKEYFRHSAGHSMVVASTFYGKLKKKEKNKTKNKNKKEPEEYPKLILSTLTDKFSGEKFTQHNGEYQKKPGEETNIHNGWKFQKPFASERVREEVFISQDPKKQELLEKIGVSIYNPRENVIPFRYVDIAITEEAWLERGEKGDKNSNEKEINYIIKGTEKNWDGRQIAKYTRQPLDINYVPIEAIPNFSITYNCKDIDLELSSRLNSFSQYLADELFYHLILKSESKYKDLLIWKHDEGGHYKKLYLYDKPLIKYHIKKIEVGSYIQKIVAVIQKNPLIAGVIASLSATFIINTSEKATDILEKKWEKEMREIIKDIEKEPCLIIRIETPDQKIYVEIPKNKNPKK